MKRIFLFFIVLVFTCSGFLACRTTNEKAKVWLNQQRGTATVNLTGLWGSQEWPGKWVLRQNGSKITGSIGVYTIDGTINGNNVYLIFSEYKYLYYTAKLKIMRDNSLEGRYYRTIEQKNGWPLILNKGAVVKDVLPWQN